MKFNKVITRSGHHVYLKELSLEEAECLIREKNFIRFPEIDDDDNLGYILKENNSILHYDQDFGGTVFKSRKDFTTYTTDFLFESDVFEKAFINDSKSIITYYEVEKTKIDLFRTKSSSKFSNLINFSLDERIFLFFDNALDFEQYQKSLNRPTFYGCNPYGENLLNFVDEIIQNQLISILKISTLDFSMKSLLSVDKAIDKLQWRDNLFFKTFLGLTLYLGECIIRNSTSYTWVIKEEEHQTYAPYLISVDNYLVPLHQHIYESFKSEYFIASKLYLLYQGFIEPSFKKK